MDMHRLENQKEELVEAQLDHPARVERPSALRRSSSPVVSEHEMRRSCQGL